MKEAKKSKTIKEPTLGEVLAVMNERFDLVEANFDQRFQEVDGRFENMDKRFEKIDKRFDAIDERLDNVDARLSDVQRRLGKVEVRVEDIQDDLTAALHSVDNDGEAILNHEHRISHLEKLGGVKSIPAKHLAGIR